VLPTNALPANTTGDAVVSSSQPLNVLVTEGSSTAGSAYNVSPTVGSTLYDPLALNGTAGFTTTITVYNLGTTTSTGTIQYYDQNGNASVSDTFSVAPNANQVISQAGKSGLSSSLYNSAIIKSNVGTDQLTALVTESNSATKFLATFQATPSLGGKLLLPTAYNNAFGSFNTGFAIANPNSTPVTATIKFYDAASGTVSGTQVINIPAFGIGLSYTPAAGVPAGFNGSAIVTASGPVVATVNELSAAGSGTYLAITGGSTTVNLPAVFNTFVGFTSGLTVLNTSSTSAQVSVQYSNPDGSSAGPTTVYTVAPYASVQAFQGIGSGLPVGFFGTATVTSNVANSLVATVNAAAPSFFYTYTEPTR
jgi:hypothetical protein